MRTLLVKMAFCGAIVLAPTTAKAQGADFLKKLAKIEGVERVHINKSMIDLAAQNGEDLKFGETTIVGGGSNILHLLDDVFVFSGEEGKSAPKLQEVAKKLLKDDKWEKLFDVSGEEGEKVKMLQAREGEKCTNVVFVEEADETVLIVMTGTFDLAKFIKEQANANSENENFSLSVKTEAWDDDGEKEPRKYRDCLIVIDGKIYPDLHTQDEAARYMFDHDMGWNGNGDTVRVLEGKELKKKYPDTKKKVAFEYTTTKNTQNQ